MSSGHELMLGFAFIAGTLSTDSLLLTNAPGGVWRGMAPPGTPTPFVVMAFQAGTDVTTVNGFRLITESSFQIKAVGPANETEQIAAAAERLDVLLGGTTAGPASGAITINGSQVGWMLAIYRQSPLVMDELVNGEIWTNAGGLYRAQLEQTS